MNISILQNIAKSLLSIVKEIDKAIGEADKVIGLKVGDIVQVDDYFDDLCLGGEIGKVIAVHPENKHNPILVEFKNEIACGGHSGKGRGKEGHCYWGKEDELDVLY